MYRSSAFVQPFYERCLAAAAPLFDNVELVFVNDGSPDDSLDVALKLVERDPRVRVVDLSRNYGHHRAMIAGLEHASGDIVFLIDCDLEEDPELLAPLYEALRTDASVDAVFGVQISRKGHSVERIGGMLAYSLINAMANDLRLEPNMLVARVMTRRFVDALISHRESEFVFTGLAASAGFRQIGIPVTKHHKGTSVYSLWRRFSMLISGITAFSDRPLTYIAWLGVLVLIAAFALVAFEVVAFFVYRTIPPGYTSVAISIWFLGGLILLALGIIARYLAVVFAEVKHRPRYIVRALYRHDDASGR
jgi:putative glycosyltransferase